MIYVTKVLGTTVEFTNKFKVAEAAFKEAGSRDRAIFEVNPLNGSAKRIR